MAGLLVLVTLGVGRSYAEAPPQRYLVAPETVEDLRTKLVWQRVLDANVYAHEQAAEYCAQLELGGRRFRLPTVQELATLLDFSAYPASVLGVPSAFPAVPIDAVFWTSTSIVRPTHEEIQFWGVINLGPRTYWADFAAARARVRCVR